MGLFSFSGRKKRSIFHGGDYYGGAYLRSSSRRYYDPRYAHTRPSMGQTLINAAGAALGGAVGAGVATNMAGKESQGVAGSSAGAITCPRCASTVPAGSKFCLECGNEIGGGFCGQCGAAVVPGARFCGQCGAPR